MKRPISQIKMAEVDDNHYQQPQIIDEKFNVFNRKKIRKQRKLEKKSMHLQKIQQKKMQQQPQINQINIPQQEKKITKIKIVKQKKPKPTKLEKLIQEDQEQINKLQGKLGLKANRLTKTMVKQDGYDDDLFDFLDHIDQITQKEFDNQNYHKFKELKQSQDDPDSDNEHDIDDYASENMELEQQQEDQEYEQELEEVQDQEQEKEQDQQDLEQTIDEQQQKIKQIQQHQLQQSSTQNQNALEQKLDGKGLKIDPDIEKFLKRNLNKLSEANIDSIFNEINKIYQQNPKQVVNFVFSKIFIQSTIEQINLLQYIISCNSVVVSAVHQIYGDIAFAEFIKVLTCSYRKNMVENQNYIKNISLVLANWYLLECISLDFVKEFILQLLKNINPIILECIIILIQYCGKRIRQDSPGDLKIIIDQIREKVQMAQYEDDQHKSKISFLILTLNDLKSNKKQNNDPTERLEFIISWLKKQIINKFQITKQCFPLGFNNCINSDFSNLNWWKPVNHISINEKLTYTDFLSNKMKLTESKQQTLEKLAIEQKLITETRKTIFKIIMGADDIYEASQNLLRLNFLKSSRADVGLVILELCGNEQTYNSYYAFLANQVIQLERGMKSKIQFIFWDKFKIIHEFKWRKISNLSKLLSAMLQQGDQSLQMIKWFQWDELKEKQIIFLQLVFWDYLNKANVENIEYQCKFKSDEESSMLKENIINFLKNQFKQFALKKEMDEEQMTQLTKMTKFMIKCLQN